MGAHYETKEDLPNSCEEWCLSPDTCVYSLCCPCIASGIVANAVSHDEGYCKACVTISAPPVRNPGSCTTCGHRKPSVERLVFLQAQHGKECVRTSSSELFGR